VWNGKEANAVVKASAISKASELGSLFTAGGDHVLKVLFSGGVIRDKKLQRGSVFTFSEVVTGDGGKLSEELYPLFETISLLRWLMPSPQEVKLKSPRLTLISTFEDKPAASYWSLFEPIDEPVQAQSLPVTKKPTIPKLGNLEGLGGGFAK
jgi:hypothetical protein